MSQSLVRLELIYSARLDAVFTARSRWEMTTARSRLLNSQNIRY
ncbi:MAG: hypothetical protein RI580_15555 [Halothece sp. Uz-M2-17]|nr:hypothetical protein [Halothece sp. Uz-M2-17]